MIRRLAPLLVLAFAALSWAPAAAWAESNGLPEIAPAPPGVDARQLAEKAENNMRADRTYFAGTMTVVSPRLSRPRVVAFHSWEDRPGKRSLIRIDKPAKDAGTGFLKLHPNLWMYVPRVERTVRIPPSMMLQSWMGSDFTNDDLVRESSELDDYEHILLGVDDGSSGSVDRRAYVIEYRPLEEAAVVWGKIVGWLDAETGAPLRQDFFDEEGVLLRQMRFSDYRKIGERNVPHHWSLVPIDKEGHSTTLTVQKMEYDVEIEDSVFTTRNLKRSN